MLNEFAHSLANAHDGLAEAKSQILTVEANAVRLAVEARGTYLNAMSLLIALCDLRNSMEDDDDRDMILLSREFKT